jgi:hypothetical protein
VRPAAPIALDKSAVFAAPPRKTHTARTSLLARGARVVPAPQPAVSRAVPRRPHRDQTIPRRTYSRRFLNAARSTEKQKCCRTGLEASHSGVNSRHSHHSARAMNVYDRCAGTPDPHRIVLPTPKRRTGGAMLDVNVKPRDVVCPDSTRFAARLCPSADLAAGPVASRALWPNLPTSPSLTSLARGAMPHQLACSWGTSLTSMRMTLSSRG